MQSHFWKETQLFLYSLESSVSSVIYLALEKGRRFLFSYFSGKIFSTFRGILCKGEWLGKS